MSIDFRIHDQDSAPEAARPFLAQARKAFGLVPNVLGVMAENPATLEAYLTLGGLLGKTGFDATEQHVVMQAVNAANACHYCTQAHGTVATKMLKLAPEFDRAIREGKALADPRLEALRRFTDQVVRKQGWVADADVQAFLEAGYTKSHVIAVILGAGYKLITNYLNHLADTPVDAAFRGLDQAA